MGESRRSTRAHLALVAALAATLLPPAPAMGQAPAGPSRRFSAGTTNPADLPGPLDDVMFRPTVLVRKGTARGSGTIIASQRGRTWVLTAAHVVDSPGQAAIELHRFNLGIEGRKLGGRWPKVVPADIVAADVHADVAVLLVGGLAQLPYVARLDPALDRTPPEGAPVTSVGIDMASDLNSWDSHVRGTALLSRSRIARSGDDPAPPADPAAATPGAEHPPRLFLVTEHAPISGRSGGGLFSSEGLLLGLCVGRIELKSAGGETATIGLFASGQSIRRVLDRLGDDASPPN